MNIDNPDLKYMIKEASEDIFRLLLEFKDYGIIMLDDTGLIKSWNMGAQHIYGYSANEIIGSHISELISPAEANQEQPALHLAAARVSGRHEQDGWHTRKDGKSIYINIIISALYNADGVLLGFAHATRDITIQKQLEVENALLHDQLEEKVKQRTKELATVNQELEAFSYSVSHDLRTPLRAIGGYAMMLQEDYGETLDAEGNRIINAIVSNTRMMGSLIDDLLTFSRMSRLEMLYNDIDMTGMAKECLDQLLQHEKKKHEIIIHPLPAGRGDANMLKQVWVNLLGNAIKYSSKKELPVIEIGTIETPGYSTYYVKDNGAGFNMKYANKLFGVFQRLHRTDEFEGTGLGLALAKRIISKHNGSIWAEAVENEGATFYFNLPKI
ncbi:sensor histidine kinase [Aridibaculum aurantiacum]|uniref:sensor histidine kinase n=1 Tax=Aridibaculum aurantiacum TaxID=2810307 RepID=UPI001A968283|nr:ATP-binding protein [Aridibaculum aurantiacum]